MNGITEHLIKVQVELLSPTSEAWGTPHQDFQNALGGKKVKEKKAALKHSPHWENYGLQELIGCGPCRLRMQTPGTATHDAAGQDRPGRPF